MKAAFTLLALLTTLTTYGQDSTCLYYVSEGNVKYIIGDYRGTIWDCTKAIELNPQFGGAYYLRGLAKMSLENIDGACLDWSKAGELGKVDAYDLIKEYCN